MQFARTIRHVALVLCACVATMCVAQDYPKGPITLTVGYGAGGGTDVCNRALALSVGQQIGQSVVVENRPGAGSTLSVGHIVRQKADGYNIGSLSTGGVLNQILMPSIAYDVTKDLTPIAMVAQYQVGVVVRQDSPYQTLAQLIDAAKRAATPLRYSTAGVGTPQHLTTERLGQQIGVQWLHVPYKSGPETITAVLRGDVEFMAQTAEWVPYVRDGRMRLLAVYTGQRMTGFDAPTLQELGYDLVAPSILGVVAPANLDPAIVRTLQDAFRQASESDAFVRCADQFGLKADFKDSRTFGAHLQETLQSWEPLLRQFAAKN